MCVFVSFNFVVSDLFELFLALWTRKAAALFQPEKTPERPYSESASRYRSYNEKLQEETSKSAIGQRRPMISNCQVALTTWNLSEFTFWSNQEIFSFFENFFFLEIFVFSLILILKKNWTCRQPVKSWVSLNVHFYFLILN